MQSEGRSADGGGEEQQAQLHDREATAKAARRGEEVPPEGVLEEEGAVVGGRGDVERVGGDEGPLRRRASCRSRKTW